MFRKLGIMWRSFKTKWLKNQRRTTPIGTERMFEVYIKDPCWLKRDKKKRTYYKDGKTYTRYM